MTIGRYFSWVNSGVTAYVLTLVLAGGIGAAIHSKFNDSGYVEYTHKGVREAYINPKGELEVVAGDNVSVLKDTGNGKNFKGLIEFIEEWKGEETSAKKAYLDSKKQAEEKAKPKETGELSAKYDSKEITERFKGIETKMDGLNKKIDGDINGLYQRFDVIEKRLKEYYKQVPATPAPASTKIDSSDTTVEYAGKLVPIQRN